MPDDVTAVLGDQRQPLVGGDELSQLVHELRDNSAVVAKRAAMHNAHGCPIRATFRTNLHAQMLSAPSSARTRQYVRLSGV